MNLLFTDQYSLFFFQNSLGEVEAYEGGCTDGLIQLKVSRSEGTYTAVQVSW